MSERGNVKLRVDQIKCKSAGVCVMTCPEVFVFQPGSKRATTRQETVPESHEKKALLAMVKCPNKAIYLEP